MRPNHGMLSRFVQRCFRFQLALQRKAPAGSVFGLGQQAAWAKRPSLRLPRCMQGPMSPGIDPSWRGSTWESKARQALFVGGLRGESEV